MNKNRKTAQRPAVDCGRGARPTWCGLGGSCLIDGQKTPHGLFPLRFRPRIQCSSACAASLLGRIPDPLRGPAGPLGAEGFRTAFHVSLVWLGFFF